MSTLRLAASVLGLLLLAALSALPSAGGNVLDGADSQELLIVRSAAENRLEATPVVALRTERLAYVDPGRKARPDNIIPVTGENIPGAGQ